MKILMFGWTVFISLLLVPALKIKIGDETFPFRQDGVENTSLSLLCATTKTPNYTMVFRYLAMAAQDRDCRGGGNNKASPTNIWPYCLESFPATAQGRETQMQPSSLPELRRH